MDEQELDSLFRRPFSSEDAMRADARARRCTLLALALWGRTPDDVQRQLLAPYPEIPAGYDLSDFRELRRLIEMALSQSRCLFAGYHPSAIWKARHEVVRRAIEYLEHR